ncbi:hypothetical protein ACL7TT_20210 [Microbulbifer sp. 2304DJ12-6]|uniref:hypothetical protein n=1 Tax=Microbulbifer sp. 2304DJ12-6 TaxID=3233340 RepID=UPI0039AF52B3
MRGRKRKPSEWSWLPKGVYAIRGWLVHRAYQNGKFQPDVKICRLEVARKSRASFYRRWEELQGEGAHNLRWVIDKYLNSRQFTRLAPRTQKDYVRYRDRICGYPVNGTTFGNFPLSRLNKRVIRAYLDSYPAPVAGNRHVQFLGSVFSWATQRYEDVPVNHCDGVKLNQEEARDRYIEDWEYAIVFICAQNMRVPLIAPAMELSYICRARRGEVFAYTELSIRREGLYLKRGKGSKNEVTLFSDRLRLAIDACRRIYPSAPPKGHLLHDKNGNPYKKNALDSAWERVITKALTTGAALPPELAKEAMAAGAEFIGGCYLLTGKFTFHDIKAKGITDHKNHDGGHRSKKMETVYNRLARRVEATR